MNVADPEILLYYWPTPNGWKVSILLEELGLAYRIMPVDIRKGDQFAPDFLAISPNNKIPAIVDLEPTDGAGPLPVFETAAILQYLASKHGRFLPADERGRTEVLQWVAWQTAGLGPTAGQVHHFTEYAEEKLPYAVRRFGREIERLYGVLEARLDGREFICTHYSIADMACWPWCRLWRHHGIDLARLPNLKRWLDALAARPALNAGFRTGNELREGKSTMTPEARRILLDQGARDR